MKLWPTWIPLGSLRIRSLSLGFARRGSETAWTLMSAGSSMALRLDTVLVPKVLETVKLAGAPQGMRELPL